MYDWGLYAKVHQLSFHFPSYMDAEMPSLHSQHVASNQYTHYRPFPVSAQFTSSPDLISRMMVWLRCELRVWPSLDVEVCEGLDLLLFCYLML